MELLRQKSRTSIIWVMAAQFHVARTADQIGAVRELFREYASGLGLDLCFQHFDEELATLPGKYAEPRGRLYLLMESGDYAGCGALRPFQEDIAELKRLYIRPAFRKRGFGRLISQRLIDDARQIGYRAVVLDTLRTMKEALALYASLGFGETAPYYHNPAPEVCYMRLEV
jgi:GNAT superfamily N-acetyltransferase